MKFSTDLFIRKDVIFDLWQKFHGIFNFRVEFKLFLVLDLGGLCDNNLFFQLGIVFFKIVENFM